MSASKAERAAVRWQPPPVAALPLPVLPRERESGNAEYKARLVGVGPERLEQLRTQLHWRLGEGGGVAMYWLGVSDDGRALGLEAGEMEESLRTLREVAGVGVGVEVERVFKGARGECCAVRVVAGTQRRVEEVRVAACGHADAGKSSLLGVITTGLLDDGKGRARRAVARHKHELTGGRTSSVSSHSLAPESMGGDPVLARGMASVFADSDAWAVGELHHPSGSTAKNRVSLSLIDTAGHVQHLRSSLRGLCATRPHYCMITIAHDHLVNDEDAWWASTKDFITWSQALGARVFFVLTKVDVDPRTTPMTECEARARVEEDMLRQRLEGAGPSFARLLSPDGHGNLDGSPCPVFVVSSVTGFGVARLRDFLVNADKPPSVRRIPCPDDSTFRMSIDVNYALTYDGGGGGRQASSKDSELQLFADEDEDGTASPMLVPDMPAHGKECAVVVVVSGMVLAGTVSSGDVVFVGPDVNFGSFVRCTVEEVRDSRGICTPQDLGADQSASVKLRFAQAEDVRVARRGAYLVTDVPSAMKATSLQLRWVSKDERALRVLRKDEEVVVYNETSREPAVVVSVAWDEELNEYVVDLCFWKTHLVFAGSVVILRKGMDVLVGKAGVVE